MVQMVNEVPHVSERLPFNWPIKFWMVPVQIAHCHHAHTWPLFRGMSRGTVGEGWDVMGLPPVRLLEHSMVLASQTGEVLEMGWVSKEAKASAWQLGFKSDRHRFGWNASAGGNIYMRLSSIY